MIFKALCTALEPIRNHYVLALLVVSICRHFHNFASKDTCTSEHRFCAAFRVEISNIEPRRQHRLIPEKDMTCLHVAHGPLEFLQRKGAANCEWGRLNLAQRREVVFYCTHLGLDVARSALR